MNLARNESHYEVLENGQVKAVLSESPMKRAASDTNASPMLGFLSPHRSTCTFIENGGGDRSASESPTDFDDDNHNQQVEGLLSIAEPLKQHGSVFLSKNASANAETHATLDNSSVGGAPGTHHEDPAAEVSDISSPARRLSASPRRANSHSNIHSFLCTVPHLCTLTMDQICSLRVMVREYDALDNVIEPGVSLQHLYVLASGTVEVFDLRNHGRAITHKRIASITAPNMFGADSLIFDKPSEFAYSASSNNTTILLINKSQFLELFTKNTMFAHSIGSKLTLGLPQFNVFQDFCRSVFAMSSVVSEGAGADSKSEGYSLHLPAILDSYSRIGTIIHPLLSKAEIDVEALRYACARLPVNITETFVVNLARSLPPFLATELRSRQADFNGSFSSTPTSPQGQPNVVYVATPNRRRSAWRIGDKGHTLVLMRDGFTDVVDFMTAFCIHVLESRKLRIRLQSMISPRAPDVLNEAIATMRDNSLSTSEIEELQRHVLGQLPLTPAERTGLDQMWPHSAIQKLYHIVMHQEQYIVRVDTSLSKRFALDSYFQWALKLRSQIYKALRLNDADDIPSNVSITILSSRHRSVKNLLCSLVDSHMEEIQAYHDASGDIESLAFPHERDRWFYTLFRMINEDSELRSGYKTVLKDCGFSPFEDLTTSGLQFDLIDVNKLKLQRVDPYLRSAVMDSMASSTRKFIINIDFTFGGQAEGIIRALFLMFGKNISSVNVVGKCAGISGNRGDVVFPSKLIFSKTAFGEDTLDEVRNCMNHDLTSPMIQELVADARKIHTGPVVTIPGMILQNEGLIRFYKTVYQADGMEMEGSYIARQVEECKSLRLIAEDVQTRFLFYMCDMPRGNEDGSRPSRSKSVECITTMYALLRATINAML